MPKPSYPTKWRGHTIQSRYGRAYWHGWHFYLKTPGWKRRPLSCNSCTIYRQRRHLKAFWAGYDMAKEATLRGMTSYHGHVDVRYHSEGLY